MIGTILLAAIGIVILYQFINAWIRSLRVGGYDEKYVFVTGCDSGFGKLLAKRLDGIGFKVFAGCYTQNGRKGLEATCSPSLKTVSVDVTNDDSIVEALEFIKENLPQGKGLYALVNNAGVFGNMVTPEMLTKKDYEDTLKVNLLGPIEVIRNFLPLVRREKGRIVNMASIMGRYSLTVAPYCASKCAFEAYLDVLRKEIYAQGIRVCMLQPGGFATNILDGIEQKMQESYDRSPEEVKAVYGEGHCERRNTMLAQTKFSTNLDPVVDAYEHALTAVFPHTRYVIGWDSKLFLIPLSYLPEWLSDAMIFAIEEIGVKSYYILKKFY